MEENRTAKAIWEMGADKKRKRGRRRCTWNANSVQILDKKGLKDKDTDEENDQR